MRRRNVRAAALCGMLTLVLAMTLVTTAAAPAHAAQPTSPNVINGTPIDDAAYAARWGSLAAIYTRNQSAYDTQYCGGTFITLRLVMTAAHCVIDGDYMYYFGKKYITSPGKIAVGGGHQDLDDLTDSYNVDAVFVHPDYTDDPATANDIAILRLTTPTNQPLTDLVDPATDGALWGNGGGLASDPTDGPWIAGWGFDGDNYPDVANEAVVPIVSDAACTANEDDDLFDPATMLCAGIVNDTDTCQGDSGSPLFVSAGGGIWKAAGITSWGYDCASSVPGIYTRVAAYQPWVASIPETGAGPNDIEDAGNLAKTGATLTSIYLGFDAPAGGPAPDGYRIYRRYGGLDQPLKNVTSTSTVVSGLLPGKSYTFVVRSYTGADGESPGTDSTLVATTVADKKNPTRPGKPRSRWLTKRAFTAVWTKSRDNDRVSRYEIWMRAPGGRLKKVKTDWTPGSRKFTKRGLKPGRRYLVATRAVDRSGRKGKFNSSYITTKR